MKVGVIGLGKLGLPVALAIESRGHEVKGYDINPDIKEYLYDRKIPFREEGLQPLLDKHNIEIDEVQNIVEWADIVFLAIQTPHEPQFEGSTRIPEERADFDYTYLKEAIAEVSKWCLFHHKHTPVVVISTCLPGTFEREIQNLLNQYVEYIYNPFFIAMGTVVQDFLKPEFVLLGGEENNVIRHFYATIHDKKLFWTDIKTAEGIKVFYNTFITMKTVLANTYGEIAHKTGMNVDDISDALSLATDRIISPKYLRAGMGDGGGCHPRDNIALSHLAKNIRLSHNIFEDLMAAREDHAEWLADECIKRGDVVTILGRAFKPETNIETGSPARLVAQILQEKGILAVHVEDHPQPVGGVVLIGTQHERYKDYKFHTGAIVIDPFGYIPDQEGIEVIRIGRP